MGQDSKLSGDNKVGIAAIVAACIFLTSIIYLAFGLSESNGDREFQREQQIVEVCADAENPPQCVTLTQEALDE